jgi:hypothetical protein
MNKNVRVKTDVAHDVRTRLRRMIRTMTHGDDEKNGDCRKIRSLLYAYRHKGHISRR